MPTEKEVTDEVKELIGKQDYNSAFKICEECRTKHRGLTLILADILDKFGMGGKGADILETAAGIENDEELKDQLFMKSASLFDKSGWTSHAIKIYRDLFNKSKDIEFDKKRNELNNKLENQRGEINRKAEEHVKRYWKQAYEFNPDLKEYDILFEKAELAESKTSYGLANSYYDNLVARLLVKLDGYKKSRVKESEIIQMSDLMVKAYLGIAECYAKSKMFFEASASIRHILDYNHEGLLRCNVKDIEMKQEEYLKKAKMVFTEYNIEAFAKKEAQAEAKDEGGEINPNKDLENLIDRSFSDNK